MAGHVFNPATKFEDPPSILSSVTSYNVSHWLLLKTRTAAILFYANYKVKTQNSAWEPGSSHSIMLKRLVPHFYPKMHLDDYWRPFFRNPSRLYRLMSFSMWCHSFLCYKVDKNTGNRCVQHKTLSKCAKTVQIGLHVCQEVLPDVHNK